MPRTLLSRRLTIGLALIGLGATAPSQEGPPVRALGPIVATSADSIAFPIAVRVTSRGSLIVNEGGHGRVLRLDSALRNAAVTIEASATPMTTGLIPFAGDSSLYTDLSSTSLVILNEKGVPVRTIAPPRAADMRYIADAATCWSPSVGVNGGLIYKGAFPRVPGTSPYGAAAAAALAPTPDSAPLLRANFDSRAVDTAGSVKIGVIRTESIAPDQADKNLVVKMRTNPLVAADDWTCLADGTIAIARAHDYHLDWIAPGGRRSSTSRIPFPWKRLTDEDKKHLVDSLRPVLAIMQSRAAMNYGSVIATSDGVRRLTYDVGFIPIAEIADYAPAIGLGSMREDRDGHVWIRTLLSTLPAGGAVYDVVSREGVLLDRVQLPDRRILGGFGPGGKVVLIHWMDGGAHLEIAQIR